MAKLRRFSEEVVDFLNISTIAPRMTSAANTKTRVGACLRVLRAKLSAPYVHVSISSPTQLLIIGRSFPDYSCGPDPEWGHFA